MSKLLIALGSLAPNPADAYSSSKPDFVENEKIRANLYYREVRRVPPCRGVGGRWGSLYVRKGSESLLLRHMTADNETRDTKTCIMVTSNGDIDRLTSVFERTHHDTCNNQH